MTNNIAYGLLSSKMTNIIAYGETIGIDKHDAPDAVGVEHSNE
jgi:hypothetical protein